jgi:four helix bundle protein
MANIAKGFHRNSKKDFMKFLDYSRSSIAETISHLFVAFDQGYITETEIERAKEQANIVWRMINNLITYLNSIKKPGNQSNQSNQ